MGRTGMPVQELGASQEPIDYVTVGYLLTSGSEGERERDEYALQLAAKEGGYEVGRYVDHNDEIGVSRDELHARAAEAYAHQFALPDRRSRQQEDELQRALNKDATVWLVFGRSTVGKQMGAEDFNDLYERYTDIKRMRNFGRVMLGLKLQLTGGKTR